MFIQVVTGKVTSPEAFERAGQAWEERVRPAATGYLGGTVGTTADGRFFISSRWDSANAAEQNNSRPEQTQWFAEFGDQMSDAEFHNCPTVIVTGKGDKDSAGFVQVMVGTIKDQGKFDALQGRLDEMEQAFSEWRSDVIGDVMAVCDDHHHFYDIIYFTSEADARAAEKMEPPQKVQDLMMEMDAAASIDEYLDLQHLHLG